MASDIDQGALRNRDPSFKPTDIAAVRAIAQAAVDVELFTIPLYMTSLYSIQGMHQITSKGNDFYQGRLWPGPATSAARRAQMNRLSILYFRSSSKKCCICSSPPIWRPPSA